MGLRRRRRERAQEAEVDRAAAIRAAQLLALTDTAITLAPDPGRLDAADVVDRGAHYGLVLTEEEASASLRERLRYRGYRVR